MKSIDEETQVFIVRLWCERREIEGAKPLLRGTVEHVPSGERRAVQNLNGLMAVFLFYLQAMEVDLNDEDDSVSKPIA